MLRSNENKRHDQNLNQRNQRKDNVDKDNKAQRIFQNRVKQKCTRAYHVKTSVLTQNLGVYVLSKD